MPDLRCPNRLHGRLIEVGAGVLEVKCGSRWCGAEPGVVVLHRFHLGTGALIGTDRFRIPPQE